MRIFILQFSLLFGLLSVSHAQITNHELEPKGVFADIQVEKHNMIIKNLQTPDKVQKQQAIDSVLKNPNDYNPPVLYALSRELFLQEKKDEACFWFYTAQLRARYSANLCMDNSAVQATSILTNEYGPAINSYALKDIDKLEKTVNKVVDFVRSNNENYDQRWINLHGMWAVLSAQEDEQETRQLSKPKSEWADIKKKTIDDYYNGFLEAVKTLKK